MNVSPSRRYLGGVLCAVVMGMGSACSRPEQAKPGIPPEDVAEFVHAVIEADRTTYAEQVVNRLQNVEKVIKADEDFKETKALPLPSQMLRMGAQRVSKDGKFRYALISPWAINKANMPKSEFETRGLEAVVKTPEQPYTGYDTVNGQKYFMALYPDKAVSAACVECHNTHPESPRSDFKLGEVMGAVVIALPVKP